MTHSPATTPSSPRSAHASALLEAPQDRRLKKGNLQERAGKVRTHRKHPVNPRRLEHDSDIRRRNRYSRRHLAILTSVAVVRHDSCDRFGRGPAKAADEQEQLEEIIVDRHAGRLHDVYVNVADRLAELDVDLTVIESFYGRRHQRKAQGLSNFCCEGKVRASCARRAFSASWPQLFERTGRQSRNWLCSALLAGPPLTVAPGEWPGSPFRRKADVGPQQREEMLQWEHIFQSGAGKHLPIS